MQAEPESPLTPRPDVDAGPGIPGQMRREAYRHPPYGSRRWLMLLAADRVEVGGALAGGSVKPGGLGLMVRHYSRQARSQPVAFAGASAALGGALFMALRSRARPKRRF